MSRLDLSANSVIIVCMNTTDFQNHLDTMLALKHDPDGFIDHVTLLAEPLTAIQFMARLNTMSPFWNHEENKHASNSVLRRWIEQGAILFNGRRMMPNDTIDFVIDSLVMFPKSEKKRCTLW